LYSVQPLRDRRGDGGFRGLLILTSILIICVVVVIRWRPNVEVRRTLRIVARLLDAGVVCVLDICM
jgi:multisubunit Na+/H+ antiporter MnhB subunit